MMTAMTGSGDGIGGELLAVGAIGSFTWAVRLLIRQELHERAVTRRKLAGMTRNEIAKWNPVSEREDRHRMWRRNRPLGRLWTEIQYLSLNNTGFGLAMGIISSLVWNMSGWTGHGLIIAGCIAGACLFEKASKRKPGFVENRRAAETAQEEPAPERRGRPSKRGRA